MKRSHFLGMAWASGFVALAFTPAPLIASPVNEQEIGDLLRVQISEASNARKFWLDSLDDCQSYSDFLFQLSNKAIKRLKASRPKTGHLLLPLRRHSRRCGSRASIQLSLRILEEGLSDPWLDDDAAHELLDLLGNDAQRATVLRDLFRHRNENVRLVALQEVIDRRLTRFRAEVLKLAKDNAVVTMGSGGCVSIRTSICSLAPSARAIFDDPNELDAVVAKNCTQTWRNRLTRRQEDDAATEEHESPLPQAIRSEAPHNEAPPQASSSAAIQPKSWLGHSEAH